MPHLVLADTQAEALRSEVRQWQEAHAALKDGVAAAEHRYASVAHEIPAMQQARISTQEALDETRQQLEVGVVVHLTVEHTTSV